MFRAIPTNNKICFDKDLKRTWKIHQQKLKRIKGSVGKQKPPQFMFLDQRPKKAALAQVRNIQIQKQNNALLTKIKTIGEKGCKTSYTKLNQKMISANKKTLNQPYRKRNLVKIVQQNQQIMKRLQSKKSIYNTKKWQKQRKEIEKNITLISSYPYKNYPSTQTQVNLWMTQQNFSNRKEDQKSVHNYRFKAPYLNYQGTIKINDSYYLVTTYVNKKFFYIQVQNLEDVNQKYRMQMQEKQVYKLLQQIYQNNLDKLIHSLQIDSQKGCLLKYKINDDKIRQDSISISQKKLQ